eukprot:4714676-Pyramimonas_sp.AAC.1
MYSVLCILCCAGAPLRRRLSVVPREHGQEREAGCEDGPRVLARRQAAHVPPRGLRVQNS